MRNNVKVRIAELSPGECPNQLDYTYASNEYYDVKLWREKDSWKAELVKKIFPEPVTKTFLGMFFESHMEEPRVFATKIGKQQVG